MTRESDMRMICCLFLGLGILASLALDVSAQEAIRNRSVLIIEGLAPEIPPDQQEIPSADVPSALPNDANLMDNDAHVRIELLPAQEIAIGANMSVRITSDQLGYLILVDVDSGGKLTQVYPNTLTLLNPKTSGPNANQIAPGKARLVPDPQDKANFRFVAAPPTGVGMLVAIVSDKPVQVIDLPDVPPALAGKTPALDYLKSLTQSLLILPATDADHIQKPKWSFATKFYVIK